MIKVQWSSQFLFFTQGINIFHEAHVFETSHIHITNGISSVFDSSHSSYIENYNLGLTNLVVYIYTHMYIYELFFLYKFSIKHI